MSLINSFTHIQENWKFVIICVQNQWGVVHPWHGTVVNLWGRHKDFTEFNKNFEKSYLFNGLSNIVKFFTVWFLKIFCIKWIHIFFWVQCSFNLSFKTLFAIRFWPCYQSSVFCIVLVHLNTLVPLHWHCTVPVCQLQQSLCSAHNQIPPRVLTMEDAYEVHILNTFTRSGGTRGGGAYGGGKCPPV